MDLFYGCAGLFFREGNRFGTLGVQRSYRRGDFSQTSADLIQLLVSHLQQIAERDQLSKETLCISSKPSLEKQILGANPR